MKRFDGTYYKHQKNGYTVALIAGLVGGRSFVQVITSKNSYFFWDEKLTTDNGIKIDIEKNGISIHGEIKYSEFTPIQYDIMGPFKYFPMQCRHKVLSLHHRLEGSFVICGEAIDFTGGIGYIEGDSGNSFPKSYVWVQCNDFREKACITVSVADIPFAGLRFRGCICIVYLSGVEYRMATYLGVKMLRCDEKHISLKQGMLRLDIEIGEGIDHKLIAPENGKMTRDISERIICAARFKFSKAGKILLDENSRNASFEAVG